MKIDRQSRQSAKKYFRACVHPDGSLNEQNVRELVQLLVTEKPRNYLAILGRLQQLVKMSIDERSVRVESASPLPDRGAAIFATSIWRKPPRRFWRCDTSAPPRICQRTTPRSALRS